MLGSHTVQVNRHVWQIITVQMLSSSLRLCMFLGDVPVFPICPPKTPLQHPNPPLQTPNQLWSVPPRLPHAYTLILAENLRDLRAETRDKVEAGLQETNFASFALPVKTVGRWAESISVCVWLRREWGGGVARTCTSQTKCFVSYYIIVW